MINSLNVAQTGLYAAKISVENVSNNISNQNTQGYKKRTTELSELPHIDSKITGRGASVDGVVRTTSEYMYNNLIRENSKESYYNKLSEMLGGVEAIFKESEENGFSSDLDRYFQSVENLRSNPNSEIYKTDLKTQATIVVDSLQRLYSGIEAQEQIVKDALDEDIRQINGILEDIGEINELLGHQSEPTNDLLDRRDLLELKLSQHIDIEVTRTPDYELKIAGEIALRYNKNIRDVAVYEKYTPQQDRYINNDGVTSNILNGITFDNKDEITYKLDNTHSVSVIAGEFVQDSLGNNVDLDGDSVPDLVDNTNYVRALAYKINHDADISQSVRAFNGNYAIDESGNKVTNDATDNFLLLEAKTDGELGEFTGRITVVEQTDATNPNTITNRVGVYKDEYQSNPSTSLYGIAIFDEPVTPKSGTLKAVIDNLTTEAGSSQYEVYKDKLDAFARTLSDTTDKYIKNSDDTYVYGEAATDNVTGDVKSIGLFSGSTVKTLTFNSLAVSDLSQVDLDYLSTLQWKKDISFDGMPQGTADSESTSFSEFYQELLVGISSDKENNDFLFDTQKSVKQSIQSSYEQVVTVDNDEEMLNLIKFQAAYTANAKVITVVDEMLDTLLNIKR